MKKLFPIFIFLVFANFGISQGKFSYANYLAEKETIADMLDYFYQDSISNLDINRLDSLGKIIKFTSNEYYKNFYLFDAYDKRGEIEKAIPYFEQLYLLGMEESKGWSENYLININQDSLYTVRKESNDFEIFAFFKNLNEIQSLNAETGIYYVNKKNVTYDTLREAIDSLINYHNKWIGYSTRGNLMYFDKKPVNIDFMSWNMDEKTLIKYYDTILSNCKKNNEDWEIAKMFKWNQLWTSQYGDSLEITKVRGLGLVPEGLNFNDDNTLLTTKFLASYFYSLKNGTKVKISPTELWGGSDFNNYLLSLTDKLIELGVPYNNLIISNEIVPMDKNEQIKEDYFFVFEIVKEE